MDNNTKVIIGSVVVTLLIIVGAAVLLTPRDAGTNSDIAPVVESAMVERDRGYNVKGDDSAPVKIVEFADFQCPACASFSPVLQAAYEQNPDKVQVMYRHFPLPSHPMARPAALAAEAAGRQGKFWEMHDLLYTNQNELSEDKIAELAQQLGLDLEQFNQDRQSEEVIALLQEDIQATGDLNLQATPTFFVNGTRVQGSLDLASLNQLIEVAAMQNTNTGDATDSAIMEATGEAAMEEATPSAE